MMNPKTLSSLQAARTTLDDVSLPVWVRWDEYNILVSSIAQRSETTVADLVEMLNNTALTEPVIDVLIKIVEKGTALRQDARKVLEDNLELAGEKKVLVEKALKQAP